MTEICKGKQLPLQIVGLGRAVPSNALSSSMLDAVLDLPEGTIQEETGVRQRYVSVEGESPTLLVQKAMRLALLDAGMSIEELDMVLLSEYPGAMRKHASVTEVSQALGLREGVPVMEIGTSGANSTSLLMTAVSLLNSYTHLQRIAVVAVDQLTEGLSTEAMRPTASLGDGAAVAILTGDATKGGRLAQLCLQTNLEAKGIRYLTEEGQLGNAVGNSQSNSPSSVAAPEPGLTTRAHLANTLHPEFLEKLRGIVKEEDIEKLLVVPHQGSRLSLNWVRENFKPGVPTQMLDIFEDYGNQGVASILFSLTEAREQGYLDACSHVLLLSMSAGLTYGAALIDLKGPTSNH